MRRMWNTEQNIMENHSDLAVNTEKVQRGKPFAKGKSGNPNGRPKGSRNKTTLATLELLGDEAAEITRLVIEKAKEGDMVAIKLVMDRLCPPCKDIPISFELNNINSLRDLIIANDQLLQSISNGEITPNEAQIVATLIEQQRKTIVSHMQHYICEEL